MYVYCRLRFIRGKRTLAELARESGVAAAYLSQIERGRLIPTEEQIVGLERGYGAPLHEMYPAFVLAACAREYDEETT
jgi:transcriptional regulator with XRE-family HTH domain